MQGKSGGNPCRISEYFDAAEPEIITRKSDSSCNTSAKQKEAFLSYQLTER